MQDIFLKSPLPSTTETSPVKKAASVYSHITYDNERDLKPKDCLISSRI